MPSWLTVARCVSARGDRSDSRGGYRNCCRAVVRGVDRSVVCRPSASSAWWRIPLVIHLFNALFHFGDLPGLGVVIFMVLGPNYFSTVVSDVSSTEDNFTSSVSSTVLGWHEGDYSSTNYY